MLAQHFRQPETDMDEDIYIDLTTVGLFLDMVARALIAYESASIAEILAQVERECKFDANELGWPEDTRRVLAGYGPLLSQFVDHHLGEA